MLIFVCFYLILLLLVGTVSRRRVNHLDDYYLAGRSLSMRWAVPTIVATWFGVASVLGVAASVHSHGVGTVLPDPFGAGIALFVCALFYAGRLYKANLVTINELIKRAYGSRLERLCSIATLPFYVGTVAAQLVAIGYLIHSFTDQSLFVSIILAGCAALGYTIWGGMWAVVIVDIVQLMFLILALGALLFPPFLSGSPYLAQALDSMWDGLSQLAPSNHEVHGYLTYAGQLTMTGLGGLMGQDLMQRLFACKDIKTAKRSLWLSSILYISLGLCVVLLGYYAQILFAEADSHDVIFAIARRTTNPTVLLLFVLCMLSATMSSANGYLLAGELHCLPWAVPFAGKGQKPSIVTREVLRIRALHCGYSISFSYTEHLRPYDSSWGVSICFFVCACLRSVVSEKSTTGCRLGFANYRNVLLAGYILFHHQQWVKDLDGLLYAAALVGSLMSAVSYATAWIFVRYTATAIAPQDVTEVNIAKVS